MIFEPNFNINQQSKNNMLNIFFQNGMDNNFKTASDSAQIISKDIRRDVGLIVNKTGSTVIDDVFEYLPDSLYLKDALNGEVYQRIANNGNQKNLIITHSAGNEDLIKGLKVLASQNIDLKGKIDVLSVGSPKSFNNIKQTADKVNVNIIKQYNNILDPVTNAKTWIAGTLGLTAGLAIYGGMVGVNIASTQAAINSTATTSLGAFFNGLIGAGIGAGVGAVVGGGSILSGIKFQHPFEKYYNKDFNNLQSDIIDWSSKNN